MLSQLGCSTKPNGPAESRPNQQTTTLPARTTRDTVSTRRDTVPSSEDDGQWRMPARNYASTRYSGLDQITTQNAKQLKLAWSFSTGVTRGHEAAPLVVDSCRSITEREPDLTVHGLRLAFERQQAAGRR